MDRIRIAHRFFENRVLYSLKSKLILSFLAISIIPLAAVVTLAFFQFQEALRSQTSNQLIVMRNLKIEQIKTYLRQIEQDIKLVAELPNVKTAVQQLEISVRGQGLNQVRQMGFLGRPDLFYLEAYHPYAVYHAKYHAFFRELVQTKGYADIWLVSPEGNIIYTYAKRNDFATNLFKVPDQNILPNQFLRNLLTHVQTGKMQMTDFVPYPPAGDIPVGFFGAPILDDDKILGALIFEVPLDQISDLMQVHTGFWKTGETYLVGEDKLSRTKTRFGEEINFFEQKVDTLAVQKGVLGESGVAIIEDYRGIPVLSAYQALELNSFKWVLLAEVDKSEAFGPSNRLRNLMVSIVFVTMLVVIGVGFYIGRSIAKPLVELAETSTRIASGDLELRARSGSRDEIGHLAEAFNSMTDQLSELIGSLKQQIAERKQAEQALRQSEGKYRGLIQRIQAAVVVHGVDTRILTSNLQAQQLLGLTEEQMMGKSTIDPSWHFFREDGTLMPVEEYPVNRVLTTGQPLRDVVVGVHRSATEEDVWVLVSADPVVDEQGEMTQVIVTFVDITERKQMEEALAAQELKFRTLAENSPDNIARYDINCRTVYVNPILEKTLGRPASEMLGPTPMEATLIDEFREYQEKITEVLQTGKETEMDLVLPDKGEGVRYHNIRFVAERVTDGVITGVLAIGRDVTERVQTEAEIRLLNQELEQRVVERTAQLEAVNRELEAFAYSVSHDLRAPLRHIDGFMELLQKRAAAALDDRSRHYMDMIADSAKRMGTLIDDLLSFSRMGRHQISKQQVGLGELTQEIIREFETEIATRNIHWRVDDLPVVIGDRAMLRSVLFNLISNALKFTRPVQQAEIEIGCRPNTETETIIFVRDNGVGFDMNYADKLFNVFQRLHQADEFEGTGIGLANVQRIITRHGGRTWATGKINQGATFYFSLPKI